MNIPRLLHANERGFILLHRLVVLFVVAVVGVGLGLLVRNLRRADSPPAAATTQQPAKPETPATTQPAPRAGFLTFQDTTSDFSIATPEGWGAIATGPAPDTKQHNQASTPLLEAGGSDVVSGVRGQLTWEMAPSDHIIARAPSADTPTVRSEPKPGFGYQYLWRNFNGQNAGIGDILPLEPTTNAQGVLYYDFSQYQAGTVTCNSYYYAVSTNKGLVWLTFPRQCGGAGAPLSAADQSAYDLQRYDILQSITLTP